MRAAYRRTDYEAGGIVVRIGRRNSAMDALLLAQGVRSAGFVTAWNPLSRRMPEGRNARMNARLREAARGRVLAEGWGSAPGWRERHFLIAADRRWLRMVACRFDQAAFVLVRLRQPPRLVAAMTPAS